MRRLHSLSGIVPIGAFLLFHFYENASARRGPVAFNKTVEEIGEMPYLFLIEIFGLILPILFHGLYGLYITGPARPNVVKYPYGRNWAYFLQRVTGIIAFAYLIFHVLNTRVWALFVKGAAINFDDMSMKLSSLPVFIFYIIGILASTFHLSNGIWSFSITWGLVQSERGQRQLAALSVILFVVLSIVGLDIISAFVMKTSVLTSLGL